jgi:hypothetical protein
MFYCLSKSRQGRIKYLHYFQTNEGQDKYANLYNADQNVKQFFFFAGNSHCVL